MASREAVWQTRQRDGQPPVELDPALSEDAARLALGVAALQLTGVPKELLAALADGVRGQVAWWDGEPQLARLAPLVLADAPPRSGGATVAIPAVSGKPPRTLAALAWRDQLPDAPRRDAPPEATGWQVERPVPGWAELHAWTSEAWPGAGRVPRQVGLDPRSFEALPGRGRWPDPDGWLPAGVWQRVELWQQHEDGWQLVWTGWAFQPDDGAA